MTENYDISQARLTEAIERAKQGEDDAFAEIYEITHKYIYQRAKYITNDETDALDLMQEVYLALFKDLHKLNRNESLFAWLKTVTFRQGIRLNEKNRKSGETVDYGEDFFKQLVDDDEAIEDSYVNQQDLNYIKNCIFELPEDQRMMILAYYYDNMKVESIAELFEISPGTVKSRLYHARKKLKLMLSAQEEKQGYKFYSFGGPILSAAVASALEELAEMDTAQKILLEEKLDVLIQSIPVNDLAAETVTTVGDMGDVVQTSGETLIKGIGTAILAKLAEFGAKKIAVSTVSIGLAAATAVTGYNAVHEERVQHDRVSPQTVNELSVQNPESKPVQAHREATDDSEGEVTEVEEFFPDEETEDGQTTPERELADPRSVEDEPNDMEPEYGESGYVLYGGASEPHHFTLNKDSQVSVTLLGTVLNSNGIETAIEGRYNLEIQNDSGEVVASTSGEMNGEDVVLTKNLSKGTYSVILYNLATEMDLYDVLPYEMWIYY